MATETRTLLARHDLFLLGAGVTFYSAVAIPPLAFLTVRLLLLLAADDGLVERLVADLTAVLPTATDGAAVAEAMFTVGSRLSWWIALACVLPATLYGEGLRRAHEQLAEAATTHRARSRWPPSCPLSPATTPTSRRSPRQSADA